MGRAFPLALLLVILFGVTGETTAVGACIAVYAVMIFLPLIRPYARHLGVCAVLIIFGVCIYIKARFSK